jgi:large-conductance mechanosensitive channel
VAPDDGDFGQQVSEFLGSILGNLVDETTLTNLLAPLIGRVVNDAMASFWMSLITPIIIGFAVIAFMFFVVIVLLVVLIRRTNKSIRLQSKMAQPSPSDDAAN